jgi:hypothetical protein
MYGQWQAQWVDLQSPMNEIAQIKYSFLHIACRALEDPNWPD